MKKILVSLLTLLLFGFGMQNASFAKRNPECIRGSRALILQALNDGALAYICPIVDFEYSKLKYSCQFNGRLVFLSPNYNYVDNQIVKLDRHSCFAEGGVYKYTNKDDIMKTVRVINIIDKNY